MFRAAARSLGLGTAPIRRGMRTAKIASWSVVPAAATLSMAFVLHASTAAYQDVADSPESGWAAGRLALTDDDAGTALFTADNLHPGSAGERCIVVSATGRPSLVRLYATTPTLAPVARHIRLRIDQGSSDAAGSCTAFRPADARSAVFAGTLEQFATTRSGWNAGVGDWNPSAATESRTFKISYVVSERAPNATQGEHAGIGFTWEARRS